MPATRLHELFLSRPRVTQEEVNNADLMWSHFQPHKEKWLYCTLFDDQFYAATKKEFSSSFVYQCFYDEYSGYIKEGLANNTNKGFMQNNSVQVAGARVVSFMQLNCSV